MTKERALRFVITGILVALIILVVLLIFQRLTQLEEKLLTAGVTIQSWYELTEREQIVFETSEPSVIVYWVAEWIVENELERTRNV